MEKIEELWARESIKQLKASYFMCMDGKDWLGLRDLFSDDIVADVRVNRKDTAGLVRGADNFVAYIKSSVDPLITVHHGHMPIIKFTSDSSATAIWSMEDRIWKMDDFSSGLTFFSMRGFGYYHDAYELISGSWLIKEMTLVRLKVDLDKDLPNDRFL